MSGVDCEQNKWRDDQEVVDKCEELKEVRAFCLSTFFIAIWRDNWGAFLFVSGLIFNHGPLGMVKPSMRLQTSPE